MATLTPEIFNRMQWAIITDPWNDDAGHAANAANWNLIADWVVEGSRDWHEAADIIQAADEAQGGSTERDARSMTATIDMMVIDYNERHGTSLTDPMHWQN